jgi:hypothetical protein
MTYCTGSRYFLKKKKWKERKLNKDKSEYKKEKQEVRIRKGV